MTKKFVFKSNKYNITHQDIERGIEDRGYVDNSPIISSESNPLDKWYSFSALRTDTNVFPSSSVNLSRSQIQDAIGRLIEHIETTPANLNVDFQKNYYVGFNFNKNKIFNLVEEYLLQNPDKTLEFVKDPKQFLVNNVDLDIKNILIYENNTLPNNSFPILKTNIGEISGHHKDGRYEKGLQGPFTENVVGGFKHRHQSIGKTLDRPEKIRIEESGSIIIFSLPNSSSLGLDYNVPVSRFSRDNFVKSAVNIKNIELNANNSIGNFSKNYQILNGLNRRTQNLALVDNANDFNKTETESTYVSGVFDFAIPDRRLLNNTYNKTFFVNKFGAPGDPQSSSPTYLDYESEELTPYNTVNYRNPTPRLYLKSYLSSPSYFGGYRSGSYGTTASYQKRHRNNRYSIVSGTDGLKLREDNAYINFQIPARDNGFSWIKLWASTSVNNGLLENGIDRDISFATKSFDGICFNKISSSFYSFADQVSSLNTSESNVLRKFLVKFNGPLSYSTKNSFQNGFNKIIEYQRKNNIFFDEIYKQGYTTKQLETVKVSSLLDKYQNTKNVYVNDDGTTETISYPYALNYCSILPNVYSVAENKLNNFYNDYRNIKNKDKSSSLFKKLLDYDKFLKENNLRGKKIKTIKYSEKIYPRGQNSFRNFSRIRNNYVQKWSDVLDNRLTEHTNSQGNIYVGNVFNKTLFLPYVEYKYSFWPLDANTYYDSDLFCLRDKSGELMQPDNPAIFSSSYDGFSAAICLPSGSYFGARFSRNWNVNRPANVVFEQAGRGPYLDSYEKYYSDIRLIGKGYSVIPEYRISPKLDLYFSGNIDFYDDSFNELDLTGSVIEDASLASSTSSAFLEQRINSDYIDLMPDLNKDLADFNLHSIKFNVSAIKKLLPYEEFYPQTRMVKLANYFSSSYAKTFTLTGNDATFRTVLEGFYAPGIGFNSIKTGVGNPYSIAYSQFLASNPSGHLSQSIEQLSYVLPWEAIISPFAEIEKIPEYDTRTAITDPIVRAPSTASRIYDYDPAIILDSTASFINGTTLQYDMAANNFYSEVVTLFKKDGVLSSIKSKPQKEWYFPDLTKKYSLDIIISKTSDFTTYSSLEGIGPYPYFSHCPPWTIPTGVINPNSTTFNSDVDLAPSVSYSHGTAFSTIIFDPSLILTNSPEYYGGGKFTIDDIKKYSIIESGIFGTSSFSSLDLTVVDFVDIFNFNEKEETWQPRIKWECPTANLNFANLSAKLTNSVGNDSGGNTKGDAIRGIWHQYAPISDGEKGLFMYVGNINLQSREPTSMTQATSSLIDIVGFDKLNRVRLGEMCENGEISEALVIIPYYLDNCDEEKYIEIPIEKFEEDYENESGLVEELKDFSKKYVLPPALDFLRLRRDKNRYLRKEEYRRVKSPFLMFPIVFSSVLTKNDMADMWQGVMPGIATKAETDFKEKEFVIEKYLSEFNFKFLNNTRFKVFKVKRRATVDYDDVIDRTSGIRRQRLDHGYNWPYDFCSLVEMADVKAELSFSYNEKDSSKLSITK